MKNTFMSAEDMRRISSEKGIEHIGVMIQVIAKAGGCEYKVPKNDFKYNLQTLLDILKTQGYMVREETVYDINYLVIGW